MNESEDFDRFAAESHAEYVADSRREREDAELWVRFALKAMEAPPGIAWEAVSASVAADRMLSEYRKRYP